MNLKALLRSWASPLLTLSIIMAPIIGFYAITGSIRADINQLESSIQIDYATKEALESLDDTMHRLDKRMENIEGYMKGIVDLIYPRR